MACPAQVPPPGPAPRRGSARARAGGGGWGSSGNKLPEARLARPPPPWPQRPPGRPGPAMIKAILIFNNHGKPRLSKFYQPYVSMPLPWSQANAGAGQRPAASSERPSRRRGPPGVRLLAPLAVSSGGGEPLPLPAGRSPSVGEAVSPPQGALPTYPVPQPGYLSPTPQPHTAAAPLFPVERPLRVAGAQSGSRSHSPQPRLARVDCFLSSADRWATVSTLILSALSNFGSPHALASLFRVFPYGSIGSPV